MKRYDLIVLGGGTAGLRISMHASKFGYNTLLVDSSKILGGTCLNDGCIPTKAMLKASQIYKETQNIGVFGIEISKPKINFKKLMKRVNGIISLGQNHIKKGLEKSGLDVIYGKPFFVNKKVLEINKNLFTANKIIICTGSRNLVIPIDGLKEVGYINNKSVLKLKRIPKSIVMIGGGYISVEFATFFKNIGSKVTILEKGPNILNALDRDISGTLVNLYKKEGVKVLTNINLLRVKKSGDKKVIVYNSSKNKKDKKIFSEEIFLAVGRTPNSECLCLENAGIELGCRTEIFVNDDLSTSNPNVYAVGDVNGKGMFAHSAKREGLIALENALEGNNKKMNFDLVPWTVFTDPPISGIGMNEECAKKCMKNVAVMKANYNQVGRSTINNDKRGFLKVVYNKITKKIIGVEMIGAESDTMIHEFVAVMNSKSPTIEVIQKTIHVHPTLSEVIGSLK